jgi:hypothetical protein
MDRLTSWPEPSSRGRSSMIVSRQYSAHAEPPLQISV